MNLDGWCIALENLSPGFDRSRLYSPCDFVFECPNADLASLIYSVDEIRMGWRVGSFAIVQQKAHPSVVFSSQRFRCFSTRDTVYYEALRAFLLHVSFHREERGNTRFRAKREAGLQAFDLYSNNEKREE